MRSSEAIGACRHGGRGVALLLVLGVGPADARRSRPEPAGPARAMLLMRAHDGEQGGSTLIRTEPFLSSWEPVGITVCLIHEPSASDPVDHSGTQPLPAALDSTNVVGCDRSFPAGPAMFDFTPANSEHFDVLADRLTNGVDEILRGKRDKRSQRGNPAPRARSTAVTASWQVSLPRPILDN